MTTPRPHGPALVCLAIVFLAAILRLGWLTQIPHTLWVDEAWFGLKGREVLSGVNFLPLEKPSLGVGDSAYQIYASAAVQAMGIPAAYSSRIASAVSGVLIVVVLYPTLSELFRAFVPEYARLAALTAAAVIAAHFPSLLYSRSGGQMTGCVLVTVLVALGLHEMFDKANWRWALLTGALIGLGQTTYEAALGLPALLCVYTGARWLWPGTNSRQRVLQLGGTALLAALAAFAPMLWFYLRHPGIYLAHVGQTQSVLDESGMTGAVFKVLGGFWNVLLGLSFQGDLVVGRNLVGRPFFDPVSSILLWMGMGWTVWRARQVPAAQLMLIWVAVMSLPSALSSESPANSRMLPMAPALAGFVGVGAVMVWRMAASRGPRWRWATPAILGLGLALGGVESAKAYFVDWVGQPRLFDSLYFGARLTAEKALAFASAADVFVTPKSNEFVRDPFELLLGDTSVKIFDAAPDCLPYANRSLRDVVYGVIQVMDDRSLPALLAAYPDGAVANAVMHPDGYAYSLFFRVPAGAPAPAPARSVKVQFEGGLRLIGYSMPGSARPGETVTLTLFWETSQPLSADLTGFVHLGKGRDSQPLIAQHDGPLCPGFDPSRWEPGYVYIETRSLPLAADAATDSYDIRVGVYHPDAAVRLNILEADVPFEDYRAQLTTFQVR